MVPTMSQQLSGTALGSSVRGVCEVLLHMRARPNLMMQTLDDVGGLVASRLHDRMQAYAGVCARVRYLREPTKRQKSQKAMTQIVI